MPRLPRAAAVPALALLLLLGPALVALPASEPFLVVVNEANRTTALPASEISKLFLKKVGQWPSGEKVLPVDLPEQSPVRETFSRAVHAKSTAAVKAYWQRMIFSGRDVPPLEKGSAAEVIAYVRDNPGAIGYVAGDTAGLGNGVKTLRVTP
jgi:ABC-type phosphate transport system substrate-binding protein